MKPTYLAIRAINIQEFNDKCNKAIRDGFMPFGNMCMAVETGPYGSTIYVQGFMYYEQENA